MKKAKLSSHMPGRTKRRPTKKHAVVLGAQKYSVPGHIFSKLQDQLAPHLDNDDEVLSSDEFFDSKNDEKPTWAVYLRGLRYREDMSQLEFAKAIGISQPNLSAMENGKRAIGKELAKRIAGTFTTDYRYLL